MTGFIEENRTVFGVEPICRVLAIAPSTYYARAAITRDPDLASDRAKQDEKDRREIDRVFGASRRRGNVPIDVEILRVKCGVASLERYARGV